MKKICKKYGFEMTVFGNNLIDFALSIFNSKHTILTESEKNDKNYVYIYAKYCEHVLKNNVLALEYYKKSCSLNIDLGIINIIDKLDRQELTLYVESLVTKDNLCPAELSLIRTYYHKIKNEPKTAVLYLIKSLNNGENITINDFKNFDFSELSIYFLLKSQEDYVILKTENNETDCFAIIMKQVMESKLVQYYLNVKEFIENQTLNKVCSKCKCETKCIPNEDCKIYCIKCFPVFANSVI